MRTCVRAVSLFLSKKIRFLEIYDLIREAMENHKVIAEPSLEDILETEAAVYEFIDTRRL